MSRNQGASLFYRKDRNTWIVQYYIKDINNKKKSRKKSFKEKAEAESFLEEFMYKKDNKKFIKNNGITLKTIIVSNTKKKMESDIISEGQFMRINKTLKQMPEDLLNTNIEEISEEDLQNYLNTLKNYSNSSIKKFYELLSQAFRSAFERDYIMLNPMKNVIRPKSNKRDKKVRALTIEEQEIFTDFLIKQDIKNTPYKNVFLIQMFTGMRIGEVLALKITDIDLAHNIINVERTISKNKNSKVILGKTTKTYAGTRQLPIPKFLRGYIMEQMKIVKQSGYNVKLLFRNSLGNIANPAQVNTAFKETIKNLGFTDVTSHTLRHTFATRCIEGGMKPVVLQRLMGHTNIQITLNTYTSVFNKYKESEITKVNNYYLDNNIISNAQKEICDYSVVCMKNEE